MEAVDALLPGAAYEVATIKPSSPSEMGGFQPLPNGGLISRAMPLATTAGTAYGKFSFQILGAPDWFSSDRYDIEAKPGTALGDQLLKLTPEQRWKVQNRMMQTLLEERLKLKTHQERKELSIFALVVAKGGIKLHEAKPGDTYPNGVKGLGAGGLMVGNGRIVAQGVSMEELAAQLTGTIDHIVSDKTGLKGIYDFTVRYSDDTSTSPDSALPSIYTAIQEQLGLKLEPTKGPVEVLVIDHVERPLEN